MLRAYTVSDLKQMTEIWNEVVVKGDAFPQIEPLDEVCAASFFENQSYCGVAESSGRVLGLYILHPNNEGRCSHIANGSYAVLGSARGKGIGRALVLDSLEQCSLLGFRGLQFNAVVDSNNSARLLYEDLGFVHVGSIPQGFKLPGDRFVDTHIYFHTT